MSSKIDELQALMKLNSHKNNEIFQRTGRLDLQLLTANDKLLEQIKEIHTAEVRASKVIVDCGGLM